MTVEPVKVLTSTVASVETTTLKPIFCKMLQICAKLAASGVTPAPARMFKSSRWTVLNHSALRSVGGIDWSSSPSVNSFSAVAVSVVIGYILTSNCYYFIFVSNQRVSVHISKHTQNVAVDNLYMCLFDFIDDRLKNTVALFS